MPDPDDTRPARRSIGPYDVLAPLGRGAMGVVWRAVHGDGGEPVALKVLAGASGPKLRRALTNEIRTLARLDHPNVAVVHAHGTVTDEEALPFGGDLESGSPWVALELADTDLGRARPASWAELRPLLIGILEGLAHAHARGVLHLDLKPANVLLRRGVPRLADFGIAQHYAEGDTARRRGGSPAYMAPEQASDALGPLGPWSDLFAVGATAWELVTGAPPFDRGTVSTTLRALLQDATPAPPPHVPTEVGAFLLALLGKHPDDRPRMAADALGALRALAWPEGALVPAPVVRRSSSATFTFSSLPEQPSELSPVDLPARIGPPALPPDWRGAPEAGTVPRHGAELTLVGLRHPPMVGRAAERDALWSLLADVHRDGRLRVVALDGPPGSGRRRLAAWVAERALEVGGAWRAREGAKPESLRAADRPSVLVVDDPAEAGATLARADLVRSVPALVIATSGADRAEELRPLLGERLVVLPLPPLATTEVHLLIEQVLSVDLAIIGQLAIRSSGLPGFVVDVIGAWGRAGHLRSGPNGYVLTADAARIPEDAAQFARARLDGALHRLSPGDLHALELLALRPGWVDGATWAEVAAEAGVAIPPELATTLEAADVVARRADEVMFVDAALREQLVERLARTERWAPWNLAWAGVLGRRDVAWRYEAGEHLAAAGEGRSGLDWMTLGLQMRQHDPFVTSARAARLREHMARLGVPDESWDGVVVTLCEAMALHARGLLAQARERSEEGLRLANLVGHGIPSAQAILGQIRAIQGEECRDLIDLAVRDAPTSDLVRAADLATAAFSGDAAAIAERWDGHTERAENRGTLRRRVAIAWLLGLQSDRGERLARQALAEDLETGDESGEGFSRGILAEVAVRRGDVPGARAEAERAVELHRRTGNPFAVQQLLSFLAHLETEEGDLRRALALLDESERLARVTGAPSFGVDAARARWLAAAGRHDEAWALLAPWMDALPATPTRRLDLLLAAFGCAPPDLLPALLGRVEEEAARWPDREEVHLKGLLRATARMPDAATTRRALDLVARFASELGSPVLAEVEAARLALPR